MTHKKILVFGATGQQGGSVVEHLLKDGKYEVIALTRDPTKEAAKKLEAKGVKVVKGDASDKDSIKAAVHGVYGVFLVTQFWEKFSADLELTEGKNVIDAALDAGVHHIVFSGLEDVEKELGYKVPHFDGKGRVAEYARSKHAPLTEVKVAFYTNNFLGFFPPKKNEQGDLVFAMPLDPKVKLDIIDVTQIGGVVTAIFNHPKEWIGKSLGLSEGSYLGEEIVSTFTKVTGKKAIFVSVPYEDAKKGFGEDLTNMFRYYKDKEGKLRDSVATRKLYPGLHNLEEFFKAHESWWKGL
jgi:uncharacterized protein YbjT (DUF2867 family)